eukprot:384814-Prorocentrum_minimum.AAC.2
MAWVPRVWSWHPKNIVLCTVYPSYADTPSDASSAPPSFTERPLLSVGRLPPLNIGDSPMKFREGESTRTRLIST